MAKKSRGKQRWKKAKRTARAALLANFTANTIGNVLGQLLADGVEGLAGSAAAAPPAPTEDVAATLLRALAERGPTSIADLMAATGVGLSPLLDALRTAREFRLVELVGEGEVVQLTQSGSHTVTVIRKDEIRTEAAKLLEAK